MGAQTTASWRLQWTLPPETFSPPDTLVINQVCDRTHESIEDVIREAHLVLEIVFVIRKVL